MKKVKFTKKFATKQKGEIIEVDSQLASQLVRVDTVAKFITDKPKLEKK